MIVVSIKFKGRGKTYFFDPNGLEVPEGAQVVVETSKGLELAVCVQGNHEVTDERIVPPLRPVARIATPDDLRIAELCKSREKEAFAIAEQKIAEHGLDMKLVDVECNFEGSKLLFFFTSDGRVDFRELVKDLAGVFRTRIELRQIGVRDEAKMLGGIGICGLPFCCHQFMDDFEPVSTKMAKTQSLSLNPTKISGSCGRLMCCLRYEQEAYEDLLKKVPKQGAFVETKDGFGTAVQVNLLRQTVKVRLDGEGDDSLHLYKSNELCAVPGGRPKDGEAPVSTFRYVPEPEPEVEEPEPNPWFLEAQYNDPSLLDAPADPAGEDGRRAGRRRRARKPHSGEAKSEARPEAKSEPAGEAKAEDKAAAKESRGARSHRGGRGHSKSAPRAEAGSNASAADHRPQEPKKEAAAHKEAAAAHPAREDGAKPKSNNRRRYYHGKPKPKTGEKA